MLLKSAQAEQGFIISDSFKNAWRIFKKEWIIVYAVQLLPIAIAILYSATLEGVNTALADSGLPSILFAIYPFAYLIIQFIVSMGVIRAYIEVIRGKKVNMDTFTSVAPQTLKYIAAQLLMMLIVIGGFLLFIIPGIIFSIKYMFTPYLVIDKGMGPIEALKASGTMTNGVKWDLVGFLAAAAILMYSGILALLVGLVITVPVATLAYVVLYDRLLNRLKS